MLQYLSKATILSLYKDLSSLDPSHKQGATQIVSSIRYFVALDRFYVLEGRECNVKERNDKELYNECVGEVVGICEGLYANQFYYPLKPHNGDYCNGSNFYSTNVVAQSMEQTSRVYTYPKGRNNPLFSVQNGMLKKEIAYYSNFAELLESKYNKVALALWLLRETPIESSSVFYNSVYKSFTKLYSSDLANTLIPDANVFEKVCIEKGYKELSPIKYKIAEADIKSLFSTQNGKVSVTTDAYRNNKKLEVDKKPNKESAPDVSSISASKDFTIQEKSIIVKLRDLAASANSNLPDLLLEAVKQMKPQSFEVLIKKLLIAMGYGKTPDDVIVTQLVGDSGIDGYVRKDRLDIEKLCAYQAKRYTNTNVGIAEMNALGGSMINFGTNCGIMVTTTDFTRQAKDYNPRGFTIVRLDGRSLVGYLIEYGIGVKSEQIEVKTVDTDFLNGL